LAGSLRLASILVMLAEVHEAIPAEWPLPEWSRQLVALGVSILLAVIFSVGVASSLARYFGEALIARLDPFMHFLRVLLRPLLWVMHTIDDAIFRISPQASQNAVEHAEQQVEDEIL